MRVGCEQEILPALRVALNFQLSSRVILVLGPVPAGRAGVGQAARKGISRLCGEVISLLATRHYMTVLTDGASGGLAAVI